MKRIGHIFDTIISPENLLAAHFEAKRGKTKRRRVIARFEADLDANIQRLHEALKAGTWRMKDYKHLVRYEGHKERVIYYDPHYEDTVVQHAIVRTLGNLLMRSFTEHTYASMAKRGIHRAVKHIRRCLKGFADEEAIYIFKCDIHHFYASIDHDVLKRVLARKVKDPRALRLLFTGVIDTFGEGIPIGNYLSPLFANLVLSDLDHALQARVRGCFRYLDDIVLLDNDKARLREAVTCVMDYCREHGLAVKRNWQIYPIERYGLDFVGYVFRRYDIRIRRRVERGFRRAARRFLERRDEHHLHSLASYWGWFKFTSNGYKLWYKVLPGGIRELEAA